MDRILDLLTARAAVAPHDALVAETIALLRDVQRRPSTRADTVWDTLHRNFELLRDRGLWERSSENDELLDALRTQLTSPAPVAVAVPPWAAQSLPPQLGSLLPVELVEILNNAYFLHVLATDPPQVLPPGKSLLSVMSRTQTADGDAKPTLRSKVEDLVHKAFWDEAVDTLSNPEPSAQLPRIRLLYSDLHVALSPLLPHTHPVLVTLSSPLSPTPSPLDSALMHLREMLHSLRERCAPARDPEIEALQRQLDNSPARSTPPVALAMLVVETVRNILRLSEIMKDDLSHFVLGSMTEQQLRSVVAKQARMAERDIVIDVWHRDRVLQVWENWVDEVQSPSPIFTDPRFLWIVRTVQALSSSLPISCPLPSRNSQTSLSVHAPTDSPLNSIPPVFFLSVPTLLKIQNYLQALVIAASLLTLARSHAPTRPGSNDADSFMSRVWTLLRSEIANEPNTNDTKLINLADEVVRVRMQTPSSSPLSKEDEARLRAAVDRTLRPNDPVFKLLQRRLLTELVDVLVKRGQTQTRNIGTTTGVGPSTIRTGREYGVQTSKRPRLMLDPEDMDDQVHSPLRMTVSVKGFEDPILNEAIAEVFQQVDDCLAWVERVWGDIIESTTQGLSSSRRKTNAA